MSIALFLLTFLFPPRVILHPAALPSTVARLSPRMVTLMVPKPALIVQVLPRHMPTYSVTATIYSAQPHQTDSEPFVTADNSFITPHHSSKNHWIALSRDMLKGWGGKFQFGDSVQVSGISPDLDGNYVIHDTMNRRLHRTIDLLVGTKEDIYGKWNHVKIVKVDPKPVPELQWEAS